MSVQRIRGEEVRVRLIAAGQLQKTIDEIKSLTLVFKFTVLTEEFLGRVTDEKDEIYKGTTGSLEVQPRSLEILDFVDFLRTRATRRSDPGQVNIATTMIFPNGDRPRLTILDAKFGDVNLNSPGRSQYVTVPLNWESSDFKYSRS